VSNGYTAGAGLSLSGNQFSVNFGTNGTAASAARSDHNHVGQSWFTWTSLTGIPTSVSNGYTAGAGLTLSNAQFNVNFGTNGTASSAARIYYTHVGQSWFTSTTLPGSSARVSNGYTAGAGLTLSDTQFSVNFGTNGTAASAARSDHNHLGQ